MFSDSLNPVALQTIYNPSLTEKELSLYVLRTDQIDPAISGNKWFKLKHNLIDAKQQGYKTLVSFGGPYSNHLYALSAAGKLYQFNTVGIIRGEEHLPLNPTLSDLKARGMKLYYINRSTYRNKHQPEIIEKLKTMIAEDTPGLLTDEMYLLPEGGTNKLAVKGASEIVSFIPEDTDFICVPCGTGGTIAGMIYGLCTSGRDKTRVLGFPAVKGSQFLLQRIETMLQSLQFSAQQINPAIVWELFHDYHFGGFGKINQTLALFIDEFEKKHSVELDPIYTAKMMYGIVNLIENNFFPKGSKIIAVHTGGLQGKRGMAEKIQKLIAKSSH